MPSKLSRADVARIAELARLDLTPKEEELFATQLTAILEYAAIIEQVDTSSVEVEASKPVDASRADWPTPSIPRDQALSQAPGAARDAGFFRVPKVL